MKGIDTLIVDSSHLCSAISALSKMSYDKIQRNSISLEDINELNTVIASIQCLAEKHAKEMETFERIA
ncbi:hypothetical protein FH947_001899 [Enterococcus faecalis]|uniref:hypothetical protein n=1 Tax=Enterococcus faecalis TaxID=1351 RepID=UPI0019F5CA00|nr:hypothetical protein [Enterococcus faecalis]EGO7832331.1 hypothetical protein [Enterococcus faecalis]EGO8121901.1 hypothetical protein [Enterococcus faecalis]EKK0978274.1 hypothetical protein [Enterococcus faecalis]EKZ0164246.1 hypothetical protein [Enterococcus faecalis]EKZ0220911.1 hypothetical protein [Enterococcus faecalis]